MMATAHFTVHGQFDGAKPGPAHVTIERSTGLISVRPRGRHHVYELPLSTVAEIIVERECKAMAAAQVAGDER